MFNSIKKYIIFMIGGGLGALINLAATYFLVEFLGCWYILAYCIGGALNVAFNFIFHRLVTFSVKDETFFRLTKFIFVNIAISVCLLGLTYWFTDILGLWYIFSGAMAIFIISLLNFAINSIWIFKEKNEKIF
jgi:putative flippase GtrA